MKQSMLALAMLAATASVAQAQTTTGYGSLDQPSSTVMVYGTIDGGIRNQTNTTATGDSRLSSGSNGIYLANRIGFIGTENLGGGMHAKFMLESGFNGGTGALDNTANALFNRSSWVSLNGDWGSLIAGRQYTVAYATVLDYNPVGTRYISLTPLGAGAGTSLPTAATAAGLGASATSGSRFSNDLQYRGNFGPVRALAEYSPGEQAGSGSNGTAQAVGLKYSEGPFLIGTAYTRKNTLAGFGNTSYTVGGSYKIGPVKAMGGMAQERQDSLAAIQYKNRQTWIGAIYSVTPVIDLTLAWFRSRYNDSVSASGQRNLYFLSASYQLSKRTVLYANVDRNLYRGALVPTTRMTSQTGISAGINHSF